MVNEGTYEWCRDWKPPPLPPEDSQFFIKIYNHVKQNQTDWENLLFYHEACNVSLPVFPVPSTVPVDSRSTTVTTVMTSTLRAIPEETIKDVNATLPSIAQSSSELAKASGGHTLPIILSLIIVLIVVGIACLLWKYKKRQRGRASLPLREYEVTNYLDNKARNNQCWNKSRTAQPPDPGGKGDFGSLDHSKQVLDTVAIVEPADGKVLTKTSSLFLVTGALNHGDKNGPSVNTNKTIMEKQGDADKLGHQNFSFTTSEDRKSDIVAFQEKTGNCSLKQAAVTRFSLKSDDISDDGMNIGDHDNKSGCGNLSLSFTNVFEANVPVSPGASSVTPLFDDVDGVLLPNVPRRNNLDNTVTINVIPSNNSDNSHENVPSPCISDKNAENTRKTNYYTKFPDVFLSKQNNNSQEDGLHNNYGQINKVTNNYTKFPESIPTKQGDIVQGPLPPIVDKNESHSNKSSSFRRKKKKSSINVDRESEPVTNASLICEDLVENRKSV